MTPDALNSFIAACARDDARFSPTHCVPVAVLAERIAARYYTTLLAVLRGLRSDTYTERNGTSRTYFVGFQDNRSPEEYNAACAVVAVHVRALGYGATVQKPRGGSPRCTLRVTLPANIDTAAAAAHPAYVKLLETERTLLYPRSPTPEVP
jgi:hypothetical protein